MVRLIFPLGLLAAVAVGCMGPSRQKVFSDRVQIVNETVQLGPKAWLTLPFTVKEKGARINGSYKTADGVDHEIIFYVTDEGSKDSLAANGTGRYYFRSLDSRTRQHMRSVLRDLDPGEYYLLFHNESESAGHVVDIKMSIEW